MKKIVSAVCLFFAAVVTIAASGHVKHVTAIGEVLGDGAKTTAVAIEYDAPILNSSLSATSYTVDGRTVKRVYTNSEAMKSRSPRKGRFVIVELKTTVSLTPDFGPDMKKDNDKADDPKDKGQGGGPAGGITAGNRPTRKSNPFPITATLKQAKAIKTTTGKTYKAGATLKSDKSRTLIADDFKQLTFKDSKTGVTLRYNLFVPDNYDASKSYPLVLFMHDASGANQNDNYTLLQGNGATVWASPRDQAKHPCFVLAPQYDEIVVDDSFRVTPSAETTIDLLDYIKKQYSVDANRVYTTGQSMGCMMSYLLMSTHPDEFAAGMLIAGQWDPKVIAPMAKKPLWLITSTGDAKSSAGAAQALKLWSSLGAKTDSAAWPLDTTEVARAQEIEALRRKPVTIRYSHLQGGWHNGTWRVAYTFAGIRDWLFEQRKQEE
ncbi:MAG: alpha/beta hydrolase-fold protein [Prevotella sp.]|nr:alpha/beta hydrolase-fold protein [Prevotella sp.]